MSRRKWLKEVCASIESKNIEIVEIEQHKSKHMKVFIKCHDGKKRFVVVSKTPSDFRTLQRIKSDALGVFNMIAR